jgi:hypothetical protein
MKMRFLNLCLFFTLAGAKVNAQSKIMYRLVPHYNHTITDQTKINNPWGMGLALQVLPNAKKNLLPMAEISTTLYLAKTKVLITDSAFTKFDRVESLNTLVMGAHLLVIKNVNALLQAGLAFINGKWHVCLKPGYNIYLDETRKWAITGSYILVFNRHNPVKGNFVSGNLGISIGL